MTKLFEVGAQFPPEDAVERLAKYKRGQHIFDGKHAEIYERATELLKDTPHAPQLRKLYIAVNLIDVLVTKPADLMVGEPPSFETGLPDSSPEQVALNRIVEENDLTQLTHEIVIGSGVRGDAWIKTYYASRTDVSEVKAEGLPEPDTDLEPIIEAVDARHVFPELSRGSRKRFKAVNIAWVEWVLTQNYPGIEKYAVKKDDRYTEIPYLNVERHIPGYIIYERYRLSETGVDTSYGAPIPTFYIAEKVATGREHDVEETGVNRPLVFHVPYKTVDNDWAGISGIEKIESLLAAINDRLIMIDYVLHKNGHPTAYGPELDTGSDNADVRLGGAYIPLTKDDPTPGYMKIDGALDYAFKELDILLSLVFQMSETPQWLFGTTVAGGSGDGGGTGTSHTDGTAIEMRMMPIVSKIKRVRVHVDKALRDAIWTAMELENYANEGVKGYEPYEAVYPKINWRDGIPKNAKEQAEVFQIRTGGKPTIDVQSAIKRLDGVDDDKAQQISQRIQEDEKASSFVDGTVFNNTK